MSATMTYLCDFTKKLNKKKVENFANKSAILCNLPFWLEIHFDLYLKNQFTHQLLLYLFWKLFLWCLKRGLVGSYTYDTFNAILEKPSLIFYESVFTWSKSLGSPLLMSQTPFLLINYCTKLFLQQSRCCILVPILLLLDLILWRILISDKKFFKSIKETSLQLLAMQFSLQIDCITFLALWCKTFSSSSNQDGRIYSR